ncbi:MAG: T9SS type A sorting domain-containing protein, partial [Bacteroidota bacterium]
MTAFKILIPFAFILFLAIPSKACFEIPTNPPDWELEEDPFDIFVAKLTILNYTTYGADTSHYCACAMNIPFQFGFPDNPRIIEASTGLPLPGFNFGYNFVTTDSLNNFLNPTGNFNEQWTGFWSDVSAAVATGIEVNLVFDIFLGEPSGRGNANPFLDDLANYLDTASQAYVTSGADALGNPETSGAGNHFHVGPLGNRILPIELIDFNVEAYGKQNKVSWVTLTEIDHDKIELQRSSDGIRFETVETFRSVDGFSFAPKYYEFIDERPYEKTYYRLRSYSIDGEKEDSQIIVLQRQEEKSSLAVYPNPTTNQFIVSNETGIERIDIMDKTGRTIKVVKRGDHSALIEVDVSAYPAGMYFIRVRSSSHR